MADFTISPGIVTNEIDQSIRSTTVSTGSVAGVIGEYNWGPAMIPTLIKDEEGLIDQFGPPTQNNYVEWFLGKNYLDYADDLNVVRVVDSSTAMNATFADGNGVYSPNADFYNDHLVTDEGGQREKGVNVSSTNPEFGNGGAYGGWISLYPGKIGNSLRVEMCFATDRENTMGMRDEANTTNYITEFVLSQPDASYENNFFKVGFEHWDGSSNTIVNFMESGIGYFEQRVDILAGGAVANQEKAVSFSKNGVTYYMLIVSQNPDGSVDAYINQGDGSIQLSDGDKIEFRGDPLKSLTVRERSMFSEYSLDASSLNRNNLLGKIYFANADYWVKGVGTAFLRQLSVGDLIEVAGTTREITEIKSDTELTVDEKMRSSITYKNGIPKPAAWKRKWKYSSYFSGEPSTSTHIRSMNNNDNATDRNDQMHMVVIDHDGGASGVKGRDLETYAFLSLAKDGRDENKVPNYYVNRVNSNSQWIRWTNHIIESADSPNPNWGTNSTGTVFATYNKNSGVLGRTLAISNFSDGDDGAAVEDENIVEAINLFQAKELWNLDFFLVGWTNKEIDVQSAANKMIDVAEERKDCVVCVSGEYHKIALGKSGNATQIAEAFVEWRQGVVDSSHAILDGNFKYQVDTYNEQTRWLPLSGDMAGLMARCDAEYKPWFSPAGYRRGSIKNVVKLAYSPSQAERDVLYLEQINPVITINGEGTLLFGDKTLQRTASAFDRINVRRLFIEVKDFVLRQARLRLFEFNTPSTRSTFKKQIATYLEEVKDTQGLSDFRVICDETNNTNSIIEQNRFVADVFIKPTYVINFIKLNFTAVGQSVEFEDLGV